MAERASLRLVIAVLFLFTLTAALIPGTSVADGNGFPGGGDQAVPQDSTSSSSSISYPTDPILDPSLSFALYEMLVVL